MSTETRKDSARAEVIRLFGSLDVLDMQNLLPELAALAEQKRLEEAERLLARLRAIGAELPPAPSAPAKYRSKKDPQLTWSGRGHVAGWLKEEMEETGLPREAFRIED